VVFTIHETITEWYPDRKEIPLREIIKSLASCLMQHVCLYSYGKLPAVLASPIPRICAWLQPLLTPPASNTNHSGSVFIRTRLVSIGIPRDHRAKTDNKRLYEKVIAKPQPEYPQPLTKYGILVNLYPAKDLQPATDLVGLDGDRSDIQKLDKLHLH